MATDHALRRWRNQQEPKITLTALAVRARELGAKVTPSHLSMIETGVKSPSLDLAAKLSRATDNEVAINEFVRPTAEAAA